VKRITTPPHRSDRLLDSLKLSNAGLAWLGLTLSIGAIGWWRNVNVIFLLAYFMLCLFFLNVCMAIAQVRRVKVIHERTKTVFAGEETTLAIAVLNPRTSSATVVVEDRLGEHSAGWLINDLKGGSSVTCYARRVFASRGLFPAHVRITSGYPIGLISFARSAGRGVVSVLPARGGIDPEGLRRWVRIQGGINERNRKVLRRVTTEPADVRGLRPYRHGDPIRTIHWRSSARRGQLVVREYDSIATPELLLVVEPWLPRLPTRQQRGDLEAALSLAVTLAVNWSRVYGTSVTFLVAGDPASLKISANSAGAATETVQALASIAGSEDFEPLNIDTFKHSLARSARLVVSSRLNSTYALTLTRATGCLFMGLSPHEPLPWYSAPKLGLKAV
jgi:uncharacterized protein (DUF58 family)